MMETCGYTFDKKTETEKEEVPIYEDVVQDFKVMKQQIKAKNISMRVMELFDGANIRTRESDKLTKAKQDEDKSVEMEISEKKD